MNMHRNYLLTLLLLTLSFGLQASDGGNHILFIQSHNPQTPWSSDLNRGILKGLAEAGVKAEVTFEYLDADYWHYASEKTLAQRYCERARARGTRLIITSGDEAFHSLFTCADSLPREVPVVFFGMKFPNHKLMDSLTHITGFTTIPDYQAILQEAKRVFPERKEVITISDNSFLSQQGEANFLRVFKAFQQQHPDYRIKQYNSQTERTSQIIASVCYTRNSHGRIVITPKWSSFLSFLGKNSKAPFFSCQQLALTNGVLAAYDADPYTSAHAAGTRAAQVLMGGCPQTLGITPSPVDFTYDHKQLNFFHVNSQAVKSATIVNAPNWEKHRLFYTLLYVLVLALLVAVVVWLIRVNRQEASRRMRAQTRLLVQSKLVEQRDEFDHVFHSIRDGLATYDTDLRIHFTNRALIQMLHLSPEDQIRPYEGAPAGTLLKIVKQGEDLLRPMLKQVLSQGVSLAIPEGAFMQEVHSGNYFPVSGEVIPIRGNGVVTGVALLFRNVSDEEMQKLFFNLAVEESSIYPWQFNVHTSDFTFPHGFLKRFSLPEEQSTITRDDIDKMIHPDDLAQARGLFDSAIATASMNTRINFRQLNAEGKYEWWEYRTSVLSGLTIDAPYSILGICQSIQRYKTTEQELIDARDKAMQADKLKSAFLANMSHEIRTPLNAIVGFSDLLSDTSLFSEEEVAQFISTINTNCGLLLALINDILDLSRIESGSMDFQLTSYDLHSLLRTVYDSQRFNIPPGVEFKLDMPQEEVKYLMIDNVRLQQVVNNLINNAAKFTTQGSITLGYSEDEPGYTHLYVEDTGKGISPEELQHIFERFYKVDYFTQGAGLGLSICLTIVEKLKGVISVTSEVGKGTRFTVRLPNNGV